MAKDKPSISIIVPCYNEEGNLKGTIEAINGALASVKRFSGHEILIYNDRSTDGTGALADAIAKKDNNVKVIHNAKNMGFGFNYTDGVKRATKDYIMMVPGDNEIPAMAIETVLAKAGEADVIIPYTANPEVRPFSTRVLGGRGGEIVRHVWLFDGRPQQTVTLRLGGSDWRTHSKKTLYKEGSWTVEARDEAGRVLAPAAFTCGRDGR